MAVISFFVEGREDPLQEILFGEGNELLSALKEDTSTCMTQDHSIFSETSSGDENKGLSRGCALELFALPKPAPLWFFSLEKLLAHLGMGTVDTECSSLKPNEIFKADEFFGSSGTRKNDEADDFDDPWAKNQEWMPGSEVFEPQRRLEYLINVI